MRQLHRLNGLGEPPVEAYLYAGASRKCRGVLRAAWPECARRAAMDVGRETGLFWPEVYLAACQRVGVSAVDGRRLKRH